MNLNNPDDLQQPTTDEHVVEDLREKIATGEYSKDEWMTLVFSALLQEVKHSVDDTTVTFTEASAYLRQYAAMEDGVREFHETSEQATELGDEIGEDGRELVADMMDEGADGDPHDQLGNTILQASSMALREPRVKFEDVQDHLLYLAYATAETGD